MRQIYPLCCTLLFIALLAWSCEDTHSSVHLAPVDWEAKRVTIDTSGIELRYGSTYLPAYSEIYQLNETRTFSLTATASIRNLSPKDSIYILSASYYNSKGDLVKNYFNYPVGLRPMETVEIVIHQNDKSGGCGANFIFDWAVKASTPFPLFEAVMISTTGQQGLSFTSRGINIKTD